MFTQPCSFNYRKFYNFFSLSLSLCFWFIHVMNNCLHCWATQSMICVSRPSVSNYKDFDVSVGWMRNFSFVFALPITLQAHYTICVLWKRSNRNFYCFRLNAVEEVENGRKKGNNNGRNSSSKFSHRSIDFRNLFIFLRRINRGIPERYCKQCWQ